MENENWKCACGTENEGSFCSACGRPKNGLKGHHSDAYTEQYLKLQIKQQEMMQAQEEKRIAAQEEKEKKQKEYNAQLAEYNKACALIPGRELKKWAGSWIFIILAAFASASTVFALVSFFTNLSGSWLSIMSGIIKLLLNSLVCAGFWMTFAMGKRKGAELSGKGAMMARGVYIFYQVIIYLIVTLVLALVIVAFAAVKSCENAVKKEYQGTSEIMNEVSAISTGLLVGLLIAASVALILFIIYFKITDGFAKKVVTSLNTKKIPASGTMAAAVFFMIIGILTVVKAFAGVIAVGIMQKVLSSLGNFGLTLSGALSTKLNVASVITSLINAGMFIFAGVAAISYGKLLEKVRYERSLLKKPEQP